jgi:ParB/RepB/Spo0J family partition protein
MNEPKIIQADWASIRPDPNQPRKEFDKEAMEQLAASIKARGILQPLLVRSIPQWTLHEPDLVNKEIHITSPGQEDIVWPPTTRELAGGHLTTLNQHQYEIIAGERRWRAAELAGLGTVPVIVRDDLDGAATFAVQMIENQQRANLTALEEADAIARQVGSRRLVDPKFKVETLAAELGISRQTAYGRMALTRLQPLLRQALTAGEIDTTVASLIATIPDPKMQLDLLDRIRQQKWRAWSFREVQQEIESDYRVSLKGAPFDQKADYGEPLTKLGDEPLKLLPCSTCSKRSGNMEILHEGSNPNVCTEPECFKAKVHAAMQVAKAKAEKKGAIVLTQEEFEKEEGNRYVLADRECYEVQGEGQGKKWKELVGKQPVKEILAMTEDGLVKVFERVDAVDALDANGHKLFPKHDSAQEDEQWKKEQKQRKERMEFSKAVVGTILGKLEEKGEPSNHKFWLMLARGIYDVTSIDRHAFVAKRMELCKSQTECRAAIEQWLDSQETKGETEKVISFVIEMLVLSIPLDRGVEWNGTFCECAEYAGVDLKAAEKEFPKQSKRDAEAKKRWAKLNPDQPEAVEKADELGFFTEGPKKSSEEQLEAVGLLTARAKKGKKRKAVPSVDVGVEDDGVEDGRNE